MSRVRWLVIPLAFLSCLVLIGSHAYGSIFGLFSGYPVVRMVVNGSEVHGDVPGLLLGGRTMVPVRFIVDALGGDIVWDEVSSTVFITTKSLSESQPRQDEPNQTTTAGLSRDWRIGTRISFLFSEGSGYELYVSYLRSNGTPNVGYLGGSISYVLSGVNDYVHEYRNTDTVMIVNYSKDDISLLQKWPSNLTWLLPFDTTEIVSAKPPFAFLKKDSNGYVRGLIVADNEDDISQLVKTMKSDYVPVGKPFSVETKRPLFLLQRQKKIGDLSLRYPSQTAVLTSTTPRGTKKMPRICALGRITRLINWISGSQPYYLK